MLDRSRRWRIWNAGMGDRRGVVVTNYRQAPRARLLQEDADVRELVEDELKERGEKLRQPRPAAGAMPVIR